MSGSTPDAPHVAVFAFDAHEASQIKAIDALARSGATLSCFAFARANMAQGGRVADVPLGGCPNGVGPARAWAFLRALFRAVRASGRLRGADAMVARNLDMALIALACRWTAGARCPLTYVCLDIHGLLSAPGPAGRLFRWVERRVLARTARLVVSAPAFLDRHFRSRQGYDGPAAVVENRVLWPGPAPARPKAVAPAPGPVRLGWVGTLRCPTTLALLAATAARMGPAVEIVLRGVVHRHQLPDFDAVLGAHPGMRFEGGYDYPTGLARAYAGLDAVWGQDLWQRGANSDWLLPNRLYEAGYFGCPLVAVVGTETARRVARDGAGIVLDAATPDRLAAALKAMGRGGFHTLRHRLLSRPGDAFCLSPADLRGAYLGSIGGHRHAA